ncbi:MAG: methionyl-tRNA formyltransferase [Hyphomicrobiales bacterium]|jgi:methionyl-tRNA formyltransferase|nr:methionyl-tRNA formyltransferase [Hyphomicrobiales bacterium]
MTLRLIFMGTPEFAVPTLIELVGHGHEIVAVYTRPPAQGGRGLELRPSPVHRTAEGFGLPVLHPRSLRGEPEQETLAAHRADLAIVVAYGLILPPPVLDLPRFGCVNLHASLLPRWRGAAPIQRAVMAGDTEAGVCIMQMEAGLDTGPVGMVERIALGPDMTAGELHDRLAALGADMMVRAVAAISRGSLTFTAQPDSGVTYAAKIGNDDSRIDWTRPAAELHNQIRGLSPFPGAFADIDLGKGPERLKVLKARIGLGNGSPATLLDAEGTVACGSGAIQLVDVQRAGKGVMSAPDFLRGARLVPGMKL